VEAVIVIDMLNDFVTGKLKTDRAKHIIPNIKRLIQAARNNNIPVIYTNDAHLPVDPELKKWGEHAMKGTEGAGVIPQLKPAKGDYVFEKRTYSGFFETGLDLLLREMGVDTMVLTGLDTNICVRHTAADAFFRGYKIVVPKDATEALSGQEYRQGLEYIRKVYDAEITETNDMVERWSGDQVGQLNLGQC
jgi:nicotinamidase-related amidase